MARTVASDFLQNFSFHARVIAGADFLKENPDELAAPVGGESEAGFQSITIPEESFEATEYREGIFKYTKKQPGPPTYSDASFMRGVTRRTSSFYDWGVATRGGSEYRADIQIEQYHKTGRSDGATAQGVDKPARVIVCRECMPIRIKIAGDLDATSGEISIGELDVAVEWTELNPTASLSNLDDGSV